MEYKHIQEQPSDSTIGKRTLEDLENSVELLRRDVSLFDGQGELSSEAQAFVRLAEENIKKYEVELQRRAQLN